MNMDMNMDMNMNMNMNLDMNLDMNFNYKLFESDQDYHNEIKNILSPYDTTYYDVYIKKYLMFNEPNEFILVNYFTKLYCWTYNNEYPIKDAIEPLSKFSNIFITNDIFTKIIESIHEPKKSIVNYDDLITMYMGLCVFYNLLLVCEYNITLDNLYEKIHLINLEKLDELRNYEDAKKKLLPMIKNMFTLIFNKNPNYQVNLNTCEYIIKHNLIENFKIVNINEYKLLYKYEKNIKKLESYKNFNPDIECLQNACMIKDNVIVIENLFKHIEPDSVCLTNALGYIDNTIIPILLEKIKPTKEQIIQYCQLKNDFTTELLIEQL